MRQIGFRAAEWISRYVDRMHRLGSSDAAADLHDSCREISGPTAAAKVLQMQVRSHLVRIAAPAVASDKGSVPHTGDGSLRRGRRGVRNFEGARESSLRAGSNRRLQSSLPSGATAPFGRVKLVLVDLCSNFSDGRVCASFWRSWGTCPWCASGRLHNCRWTPGAGAPAFSRGEDHVLVAR